MRRAARNPARVRLVIVTSMFPYGPKEPYLATEIEALAAHVESIIVVPTSPKRPRATFRTPAVPLRLSWFGPRTLGTALLELVQRPRQAWSTLVGLLRADTRLSVLLKNLVIYPLGLAAAYRLRRRHIDHVHSYWLSTPATVALIIAGQLDIPFSSTGHAWDIYEKNALRLKGSRAAFVRAISDRGKTDIAARMSPVPPIAVLHVGVRLPPAPANPAQNDSLAIICAANLVPKKGHVYLLRALKTLRERGIAFSCTCAGDGELRAELEALAVELDLAGVVRFPGHVAHGDMLRDLHAGRYHVAVLASTEDRKEMEGIPVALMEAMAAGLPAISTASGSIAELLDDSCGRLVPQRDPERLALAIAEVAADASLRERLGAAARARIAQDYSVERTAHAWAALFANAERP